MEKKLGLTTLTALVLSSMLGAGIFSLPQNMAEVASPAALLIGWAITGTGILFLAFALLLLTRIRPDLDGGIFTYAKEGFGELIGFCSAWGYWICAVVANLSYLVIVFAALSFFTDSPGHVVFGEGNTWQAMLGASVLLWIVHGLILRGVQTAALINLIATLAKLIPIALFIILATLAFNIDVFKLDFTGVNLGQPVWEQVKSTMLITLWVFIGIEGAVVVSGRAKHKADVGRATVLAVLMALCVYLLITLLSLGVVPRIELAGMRNPSMSGVMVMLMGPIGEIVIAAGLIISVCAAYLSWTIMAAEVPFLAAQHGAFPHAFIHQNHKGAPSASLWFTNGIIQLSLLLIWLTGSNYNTLLIIASEMILIPYFLVGAFLLKEAIRRKSMKLGLTAAGASIYGLWLIYASGLENLFMSVVLYAPGILVFIYARYAAINKKKPLNVTERAIIVLLFVLLAPALWMTLS
ncbi:amino acid permease [Limnobaculum zhutongyuii]|uniref:Amino acid permease n=1 Tax=Limnobaculum zhutongyuii TaxID=2498113 RepID=A0A411WJA8_9GAMM|nr:amino acid permease [Limnobaculum zhutongyuii]QBH96256.1 amino acid permease [Limnobaculum zhutongyuii]TQS87156.1 amino acid permease [Limnobaculum zhutongyuii]